MQSVYQNKSRFFKNRDRMESMGNDDVFALNAHNMKWLGMA